MRGAVPPPQYVFVEFWLSKRYIFTVWYLVKHKDNFTSSYFNVFSIEENHEILQLG
jgi:hypothetical protein